MNAKHAFERRMACVLLLAVMVMATTSTPAWADDPPRESTARTFGDSPGTTFNVGDPINAATGEYYFTMGWLNLSGVLPLDYRLYYGSQVDSKRLRDGLPFRFSGNQRLTLITMKFLEPPTVFVETGLGAEVGFHQTGDGWAPYDSEGIRYQLKASGDLYYFLDPIRGWVSTFRKVFENANLSAALLASIQDRNGNALTYEYPSGQDMVLRGPDRVSDGLGRELRFTYATVGVKDANPYLVRVEDQNQRAVTLQYEESPADNPTGVYSGVTLRAITDPLGNVTTFQYGDQERVTALKRPAGNVPYQQTYNPTFPDRGVVATQTDALGNVTRITPDRYESSSKETLYKGQRVGVCVVSPESQFTVTYPDGSKQVFQHDRESRIVKAVTDATGKQATFESDPTRERITGITDRLGGTTKIGYHAPTGKIASLTNARGDTVTFTYTPQEQTIGAAFTFYVLTSVEYPDKQYDALDRVISVADAANRVTKFEYDASGNLAKMTGAVGQIANLTYDAMDRLIKAADGVGQIATLIYNPLGQLASTTNAVGQVANLSYDPRGWLNAVTRTGASWKLGYDDEGLVVSLATPLGNISSYKRDNLGYVVARTDALGNTTAFTRDARNRVTGVTDPLKRATAYTYDAGGWLSSVSPPELGAAKYERDALGNITRIFDLNGNAWTFAYTAMGRMQARTDPLKNNWKYAYDARGRLSQVTYPDNTTRTLAYDAAGNATRDQYSDGLELQYEYDALNRLTAANDVRLTRDARARITNTANAGANFGATYNDAGALQSVTYNNGAVTVTYTYDTATGLLKQVSDGLTKAQVDFTYDKDNRLIGLARSNKVNTTLSWDNAGRLTRIQDVATGVATGGSPVVDLQYTLDAAGQVTGVKTSAPLDPTSNFQSPTSNFQYDSASQITTTGYKYDPRGRLIQSPNEQFKWDGASRLTSYQLPANSEQLTVSSQRSSVALAYNGFGDVISRTDGNATTQYAYNYALGLGPIVAEMNGAATVRNYVWAPGGTLLYAIENDKPVFYHFDRTGSTLALTDANGKVTDAYAYDPYGALLAHEGKSTQPFTFVGKWGVRQDDLAGRLYQMRARYYDATTARFISRDPAGSKIYEPRELNPYTYAQDNPINRGSPTGVDPEFNDLWNFGPDVDEFSAIIYGTESNDPLLRATAQLRAELLDILVAQQAPGYGLYQWAGGGLASLPVLDTAGQQNVSDRVRDWFIHTGQAATVENAQAMASQAIGKFDAHFRFFLFARSIFGGGGVANVSTPVGNRETPNKAMLFFQQLAQGAFPPPPVDDGIGGDEWSEGLGRIVMLLQQRFHAMSEAEQQQFMQNLSPGEQQAVQLLAGIYGIQQFWGEWMYAPNNLSGGASE
ncbi:MAG: RHS repeat protein [Chloroflexi bacterium]|nr:RHS repeat protein [Chloroflexota bacterium]